MNKTNYPKVLLIGVIFGSIFIAYKIATQLIPAALIEAKTILNNIYIVAHELPILPDDDAFVISASFQIWLIVAVLINALKHKMENKNEANHES